MNTHSFIPTRRCFTKTLLMYLFLSLQIFFLFGCNFNILGGSNSQIQSGYTPGLRNQSAPPTISPFQDIVMDENDSITIPFQIADPDTILFCNGINLSANSTNTQIINPLKDIYFSGTYPNCTMQINSHSVSASTQLSMTVSVYDFWSLVGSSFKITVKKVLKPGPFQITYREGLRKSMLVHWSDSDYMDGSSARYFFYYKPIANQSLEPSTYTGVVPLYTPSPSASQSTFTEIRNVKSPEWVMDLADSTVYEVYVTARNAFNIENPTIPPTESDHVFIRTLDRFQFKVREFVASSQQEFKPPAVNNGTCLGGVVPMSPLAEPCAMTPGRYFTQASLGSPMERTSVLTGTSRYRVYLNAQGLMFGADE